MAPGKELNVVYVGLMVEVSDPMKLLPFRLSMLRLM